MARVYKNNAVSTFANPVGNSDVTVTLVTGGGSKFPTLTGGNTFQATFSDAATGSVIEVVTVTAVTGDVLSVTRAQEGTTAQSYLAGDNCSQRVTAAELGDFASLAAGGAFLSPISATQITSQGLLFGNGGSTRGIGNVNLQSGGSPSGGANGDLFFIY